MAMLKHDVEHDCLLAIKMRIKLKSLWLPFFLNQLWIVKCMLTNLSRHDLKIVVLVSDIIWDFDIASETRVITFGIYSLDTFYIVNRCESTYFVHLYFFTKITNKEKSFAREKLRKFSGRFMIGKYFVGS